MGGEKDGRWKVLENLIFKDRGLERGLKIYSYLDINIFYKFVRKFWNF